MKNKLIPIVKATAAAVTLIGVNTFLHPCSGMMVMKCQRTTNIGSAVLALIIAASLAEMFISKKLIQRLTGVITTLMSIALFFIPLLGHCGGARMHCNTHTMPAFRISALVILAFALAGVIREIISSAGSEVNETA